MTDSANLYPRDDGRVLVKVFRIDRRAKMPTYAKPGDSGMDLATLEDVRLTPGSAVYIDTGLAFGVPAGYEAQVRPRSSLSRRGIVASWGTCDSGYRGTVGVILTMACQPPAPHMRFPLDPFIDIKAGDRIAQLVIAPVPAVALEEVNSLEALGTTERGAGGWGSTGA